MKHQLLLVEDDSSLGSTLQERLQKEEYDVTWSRSLKDARASLSKNNFDLIILDVGLPDGSGFDLAQEIKSRSSTPFIFMTAQSSAPNRLAGFEMGAEEFIPKPFHLKEILIRVKHVLENHAPIKEIRCGDRVIDFQSRSIRHDDGQVNYLPTREFELLQILIRATPRVVSRDEILDTLWGEEKFPSNRTIDNMIVKLRDMLGDEGEMIRSARGVGYQWVPPGESNSITQNESQEKKD